MGCFAYGDLVPIIHDVLDLIAIKIKVGYRRKAMSDCVGDLLIHIEIPSFCDLGFRFPIILTQVWLRVKRKNTATKAMDEMG